jgi:two-component sensor histidine kinase
MDDVQLTIDMAIPLGLVYNECLSNSLKYAFNDVAMPRITISGRINGDSVELGYADNGSGLPAGFDAGKCQTFGMRSIAGIIEHQLQGKMEVISGEGLQYLFVVDIARFRERV